MYNNFIRVDLIILNLKLMKHKFFYIILFLVSGFLLSGCLKTVEELGWGNFDKPNPTIKIEEPTPDVDNNALGVSYVKKFGIESCDQYLNFMVCASAKLDRKSAQKVMDEITKEWELLDTEILTSTCTQLVKEVQESPQQFTNGLNCEI